MRANDKAIVSLIGDAVSRARVASLLREITGSSCVCLTSSEVRARLQAGSVHALVIGAYDRDGCPMAPFVAEVRRSFPNVSIIAYWEAGRTPSSAMVSLLRAGAHQVIVHPHDDAQCAFQTALLDAQRLSVAEHVIAAVADAVPAIGRPLMELYIRGADGPIPVTEAARQLGVHRKTLRNRMDAAGLPAPADLRAWCRLFMAGRLLEEGGRTVESVAHQLEFSTGSALRNLIKRRTGPAPYMLREAGGLPYLIACFNAVCETRRLAHANGHAPKDERPVPLALVPMARVAEPAPKGASRGRSRSSRAATRPDRPR